MTPDVIIVATWYFPGFKVSRLKPAFCYLAALCLNTKKPFFVKQKLKREYTTLMKQNLLMVHLKLFSYITQGTGELKMKQKKMTAW